MRSSKVIHGSRQIGAATLARTSGVALACERSRSRSRRAASRVAADRSAAAVASKDSTFLAMQKEHLLLPRPGKSDDLHHHRFSARNIIRENNKQQSILDNEQQGSGKNQGSKDKRRHDRFSIPGVVDIPAFSGNPVELKNISTGGLLLSLADEPDSEGDFEVTLTIKGKDYRWKNVTVAWTNKDEEHLPWTAGLKVEMTDEERDHFKDMLEEMDP